MTARLGKQRMWFIVFKHLSLQIILAAITQSFICGQLGSYPEPCGFLRSVHWFEGEKKNSLNIFAWYALLKSNLQNTVFQCSAHTIWPLAACISNYITGDL